MFHRHYTEVLSTSQSSILKSYQSKRILQGGELAPLPPINVWPGFVCFSDSLRVGTPKIQALPSSTQGILQYRYLSLLPPLPPLQCLWPLFGPTVAMCHSIQIRNCCLRVTSYMQSQVSHSTSPSSVLSPKLAIGRHWALYFWRLWVPPHMRVKTCYTLWACH